MKTKKFQWTAAVARFDDDRTTTVCSYRFLVWRMAEEIRETFLRDGYALVDTLAAEHRSAPWACSRKDLALLRAECQSLASLPPESECASDWVAATGCIVEPWQHFAKEPARVPPTSWPSQEAYLARRGPVGALLRQNLAALAAAALGGSDVRLLNEQYIVKPPGIPGNATAFALHQDARAMGDMPPVADNYVSVWLALDDVDEFNGGLRVRHRSSNEQEAIEVPAGTACLLDHLVWHDSASNRSPAVRRAFMPQFFIATH